MKGLLTTTAGVLATVVITAMATDTTTHDEALRKAIEYVRALPLDCVLTDGYVCAEPGEEPGAGVAGEEVPGAWLRAWEVAYRDFLSIAELTSEQKDLRHYRVSFAVDGDNLVIELRGLLLPWIENGKPAGTLLAVFGRSTRYVVSRRDLRIVSRRFLR